jgi:ribosomal protein S18 acetylase RimI-like enzyme
MRALEQPAVVAQNSISCLNLQESDVAESIHGIFQRAYRVEAQLIGVDDFPPLHRSAQSLKAADSQFIGLFDGGSLAAVVEISKLHTLLGIESLVVEPNSFRKGFATQLLCFVLTTSDYESATVDTAFNNKAAISLYQKFGFLEARNWKTPEGIRMVSFHVDKLL